MLDGYILWPPAGATPNSDTLEMAHSWPPAVGDAAEIMAITRPGPELHQAPGRAHSRQSHISAFILSCSASSRWVCHARPN